MKNKTISLFALTILSLVMIIGMTSAAALSQWTLTINEASTIVDSNLNAGNLTVGSTITGLTFDSTDGATAIGWNQGAVGANDYYEVKLTASTGYNFNINSIGFNHISNDSTTNMSFDVKWSKDNFASSTSLITGVVSTTTSTLSSTSTNINLNGGETLSLRIFGYNADAGESFSIKNLLIQGTAIPTSSQQPDEIISCSATGTHGDDLRIEIDNLDVIKGVHREGFGNDEEWFPLDEIEVEIKVENDHATEKIKNIEIKWGLYDKNNDRWYIDEKESDFNLADGDDKTITVNFKLDKRINKFADGDYVFYVWANGEINDDNDTPVCSSDSQDIEMIIESDFVILDNIEFQDVVECGSTIQLTADVWNIGDDDQQDVYVVINNQALGINKKVNIGDVDAFEDAKLDVLLDIPNDVDSGKFYQINLFVYNEDDELFQNDYDDDESEFVASVKVEGNCGVAQVILSASLQSGGIAGEPLVVEAVITNTGSSSATYVVKPTGFSNWATSSDQIPVVLAAGQSKNILLTLNVNEDVSGAQSFNIEVLSESEVVLTQPVSVTIEASSGAGITGGFLGALGDNKYIWAIAALNVILVVIIIIVAIKVAMK